MPSRSITDWDDAYTNDANIPGGERWPAAWEGAARDFRDRRTAEGLARLDLVYGDAPRNRLDLFLPVGEPKGLVVFVHGGYWMALDKSAWSHLARGAVERGHAVAMPSYTLCPESRIADITLEIGAAIETAAKLVDGPIALAGHSAGGHLATRMVCSSSPLVAATRRRIGNVLSISGLHDLRPMLRTAMNGTLHLDAGEAAAESPALLEPLPGTRLTCWAGASERAEFLRQSSLLANIWTGLGATTASVVEPDRHHFNVVDSLADPNAPIVDALLART